jgi:hypothetical protein
MSRLIPIPGRPHHYYDEANPRHIIVTRDGMEPEQVLAEALQPAPETYADKRRAEYPPIAEQLDMIYHDIDAWRARIAAIKRRNPRG